jgi:TPP-dependent pyruvate/acetoin dehydrogenase alpha subunit
MKATALGREKAIELYIYMLKARFFDEKAMELFTAGQIPGFIHVGIGQEAVPVGVCANLRKTDKISTTHRGHSQVVAKGCDLKRSMSEIFGKQTGFCGGRAGSMHVADKENGIIGASGIVGAGLPIATGVALASKYQGTNDVTVCFFGDGASNEGTFHESINIAAVWQLPIVYCLENNGWAQFTSLNMTSKLQDLSVRAAAYGIPGVTVNGDDVLAVFEAAGVAIERARKGEGPTLLECKTHRWFGHYVGDPQKYRVIEDLEGVRKFDPIPTYEATLIKEKLLTPAQAEQIKAGVKAEIDEAVKFAQDSPLPKGEDLLKDVYFEGEA